MRVHSLVVCLLVDRVGGIAVWTGWRQRHHPGNRHRQFRALFLPMRVST